MNNNNYNKNVNGDDQNVQDLSDEEEDNSSRFPYPLTHMEPLNKTNSNDAIDKISPAKKHWQKAGIFLNVLLIKFNNFN